MTDNTELKRLAEHHLSLGQAYTVAKPSVLLALIAENDEYKAVAEQPASLNASPAAEYEGLKRQFFALRNYALCKDKLSGYYSRELERLRGVDRSQSAGEIDAERDINEQLTNDLLAVEAERDQLKAESAGLKTGYEAYEQVVQGLKAEVEALRKDKDRLDALESNFWDVRHNSHPIADTGDSSSSLEIVGHWMDKPFERVIGEDYNENLRAAIDQAMKAPAYPPARPEYEFEFGEIPDFGGGSGNKARRRAESMGIDYAAALGKEEQS